MYNPKFECKSFDLPQAKVSQNIAKNGAAESFICTHKDSMTKVMSAGTFCKDNDLLHLNESDSTNYSEHTAAQVLMHKSWAGCIIIYVLKGMFMSCVKTERSLWSCFSAKYKIEPIYFFTPKIT